jgi:hypothetical protein
MEPDEIVSGGARRGPAVCPPDDIVGARPAPAPPAPPAPAPRRCRNPPQEIGSFGAWVIGAKVTDEPTVEGSDVLQAPEKPVVFGLVNFTYEFAVPDDDVEEDHILLTGAPRARDRRTPPWGFLRYFVTDACGVDDFPEAPPGTECGGAVAASILRSALAGRKMLDRAETVQQFLALQAQSFMTCLVLAFEVALDVFDKPRPYLWRSIRFGARHDSLEGVVDKYPPLQLIRRWRKQHCTGPDPGGTKRTAEQSRDEYEAALLEMPSKKARGYNDGGKDTRPQKPGQPRVIDPLVIVNALNFRSI